MRSHPCRPLALRAGLAVSATAPALGLSLPNAEASGQTLFSWASPVDGSWTEPTNWSPEGWPAWSHSTAILGFATPYTVTLGIDREIFGLSIPNPNARLVLQPGGSLVISDQFLSAGTIEVIGTDSASTLLTLPDPDDEPEALSLSGAVRLAAPDDVAGARVFFRGTGSTIDASATISGRGTISGSPTNLGLVIADGPGDVIRFTSGPFNQDAGGRIVAADGGAIIIATQQGVRGPVLASNGSTISFVGTSTATYATITLTGGSTVHLDNATLAETTVHGALRVNPDEELKLQGESVITGGVLVLGEDGSPESSVRLLDEAVLHTDLTLASGPDLWRATLYGEASSSSFGTIGAGSTVTGRGRLVGPFGLNGLIAADGADSELQFINSFIEGTGNATIASRNGGTLRLRDAHIVGTTVEIDPDSALEILYAVIDNSEVIGGPIELGVGDQLILRNQGSLSGPLVFFDQHDSGNSPRLELRNGNDIDFDISVGSTEGAGFEIENVNNGEVENPGPSVIPADRTITGHGSMTGAIQNRGTISATTPGRNLVVDGVQNLGTISAGEPGATIFSRSISQSDHGVVRIAEGSMLVLRGNNSPEPFMPAISGGTLVLDDGSELAFIRQNAGVLEDIDIRGRIAVTQGQRLRLGGAITVDDSITLTATEPTTPASIAFTDGATFDGELRLVDLTGAFFPFTSIGFTNTRFAPGSVIRGSGTLIGTGELAGTIRPGGDGGPYTFSLEASPIDGDTLFAETTVFDIFANPDDPTEHGAFIPSFPIQLDGTLRVHESPHGPDAYRAGIEVFQESFFSEAPITGRFDAVEYVGTLGPGEVPRVFYEPERVVFALTCAADLALPVGVIDEFDVFAFIETWSAQGEGADFNEDGTVDILDVVSFIQLWNTGCPE